MQRTGCRQSSLSRTGHRTQTLRQPIGQSDRMSICAHETASFTAIGAPACKEAILAHPPSGKMTRKTPGIRTGDKMRPHCAAQVPDVRQQKPAFADILHPPGGIHRRSNQLEKRLKAHHTNRLCASRPPSVRTFRTFFAHKRSRLSAMPRPFMRTKNRIYAEKSCIYAAIHV